MVFRLLCFLHTAEWNADLAENKSATIRSIHVIRVLFLLPAKQRVKRDTSDTSEATDERSE